MLDTKLHVWHQLKFYNQLIKIQQTNLGNCSQLPGHFGFLRNLAHNACLQQEKR